MPRLTTLSAIRKKVMPGLLATVVAALIGFQATGMAAQAEQLWTVIVHFEYDNGFELDYPIRRGVSTAEMVGVLQDCGRAHRTPSVVLYYCYPIPE